MTAEGDASPRQSGPGALDCDRDALSAVGLQIFRDFLLRFREGDGVCVSDSTGFILQVLPVSVAKAVFHGYRFSLIDSADNVLRVKIHDC